MKNFKLTAIALATMISGSVFAGTSVEPVEPVDQEVAEYCQQYHQPVPLRQISKVHPAFSDEKKHNNGDRL